MRAHSPIARGMRVCESRPMNLLLLAFVPACFALNPVTGRALAEQFGPASLSLLRWSLSGLIIAALALVRWRVERWRASPSHLLRLLGLGALAMGFCASAAYMAARTSEATNISLIYGFASALVAAWEIAAGRLHSSTLLLAGIGICLAGVIVILTRGHPDVLLDLRFTPGDLWATAGMLVFVGYTVAMRRVPSTLTVMPQFVIMSLGASLVLLPFATAEVIASGLPILREHALPWLATVVLATGIGAFLGYNVSLKLNGPVLTSASLTLTPAFSAAQAMLLIGEQLAWYHAAAIALVVTGLLLINRDQARR